MVLPRFWTYALLSLQILGLHLLVAILSESPPRSLYELTGHFQNGWSFLGRFPESQKRNDRRGLAPADVQERHRLLNEDSINSADWGGPHANGFLKSDSFEERVLTEGESAEGESQTESEGTTEVPGGEGEGESGEGEGESGEGEGETGEGEEEGEEGEEEVDETSLTVAFLLIGIVAFVATLFYLVNYNDSNIKKATWDLLSDSLSIFCAVLWYQAIDAIFDDWFEKGKESARCLIGVAHFLLWYVGVQIYCISIKHSDRFGKLSFRSGCVLGAHLSGFAAKDLFNTIMQTETFRENAGMCFVSILINSAIMAVVILVAFLVRNYLVYPRMEEEKVESCGEQVREVENDMVSLSIGFCVSMFFRFALHGKLPTEELDEKDYHKQWQAWVLFLLSCLCAVLAVAVAMVQFHVDFFGEPEDGGNPHASRGMDILKTTFVMTKAWCLLYWGQWEIFDTHFTKRVILGRVILAFMISYYAIIVFLVFDYIADRAKMRALKRGARLICKSFGLSVAFSWEATFDASVETIAEAEEVKVNEAALKILLALFLILIVAPAWGMYVLPKSLASEEEDIVKDRSYKDLKKGRTRPFHDDSVRPATPTDDDKAPLRQAADAKPTGDKEIAPITVGAKQDEPGHPHVGKPVEDGTDPKAAWD